MKTLKHQNQEDTGRKDLPSSQIRINIGEMAILLKLIYRFNTIHHQKSNVIHRHRKKNKCEKSCRSIKKAQITKIILSRRKTLEFSPYLMPSYEPQKQNQCGLEQKQSCSSAGQNKGQR